MEEGDGGDVYDDEIRRLGLSLAGVGVGSKEAVGESSGSPAALSPPTVSRVVALLLRLTLSLPAAFRLRPRSFANFRRLISRTSWGLRRHQWRPHG